MKGFRLTIASILILWCGGFFYYVYVVENTSNDNRKITDAIVVFGGNKQRLYAGVQLLKFGYAPLIFITGDKPEEEYKNYLRTQNLAPEQFIFDEYLAKNKQNHALDKQCF